LSAVNSRPKSTNKVVERSNHPNYFLVQLGMVAFNEKTSRPPGEKRGQYCYYENLAFATSNTKEYIKTWYHGLAGEGFFSDYTNAFSTAFMYFNNSRSVAKDHRPRSEWSFFVSNISYFIYTRI